jgi:AcrR family transcriptional regulator
LIDKQKLARNRRERGDRKRRILEAARRAFLRMPYSGIDLETIAKLAKVRDGQPAMYFGSKEELFVQILQGELRLWEEEVASCLGVEDERHELDEVVATLARTVAESRLLTRLLTLMPMVVEQHPDPSEVLGAYHEMSRSVERTGALIDHRVRALQAGDGARLLRRLHILIPGLQEHARPTGIAALRVADADLATVEGDFETELREMLGLLAADRR